LADGEELQAVEDSGAIVDDTADRRVEYVPIGSCKLTSSRAGRMSPGGGISTCSLARNTSVPNTRRIGWAKLDAVYCVAMLGSG